jgi:excisionase family DNA binding protein
MRFVKEQQTESVSHAKPPPNKVADERNTQLAHDGLTDIDGVARTLGVSKRYVQSLVKRKVIPVIRLGRRCTRFDLARVLAAIRKYEVIEIGRK